MVRLSPRRGVRHIETQHSAITNYLLWLEQEKVLTVNPAESIRYLRVTSPLPDILFESECQQLTTAASTDPRTYLLLLLLLEAGMKKEELFALKLTHFDFSNKYAPEMWVKHTGRKVKKDRKLKLPPEVVPVFADYVKQYSITDSLFPFEEGPKRGPGVSPSGVGDAVRGTVWRGPNSSLSRRI